MGDVVLREMKAISSDEPEPLPCSHGQMVERSGFSRSTGKPWRGMFCPEKVRGCKAVWLEATAAEPERDCVHGRRLERSGRNRRTGAPWRGLFCAREMCEPSWLSPSAPVQVTDETFASAYRTAAGMVLAHQDGDLERVIDILDGLEALEVIAVADRLATMVAQSETRQQSYERAMRAA